VLVQFCVPVGLLNWYFSKIKKGQIYFYNYPATVLSVALG